MEAHTVRGYNPHTVDRDGVRNAAPLPDHFTSGTLDLDDEHLPPLHGFVGARQGIRHGLERSGAAKQTALTPAEDEEKPSPWALIGNFLLDLGLPATGYAATAYGKKRGSRAWMGAGLGISLLGFGKVSADLAACGAPGVAIESPVPGGAVNEGQAVLDTLTVGEVDTAVRRFDDFHIANVQEGRDVHLNRIGDIQVSSKDGAVVTAPFSVDGKDGWVFTLALSTLESVGIEGAQPTDVLGTDIPSYFLIAQDPATGATESYYLFPDQEVSGFGLDHFWLISLDGNGYGFDTNLRFQRVQTAEGIQFKLFEKGKTPVDVTPAPEHIDGFVNISFNPVNSTIPTPGAEVPSASPYEGQTRPKEGVGEQVYQIFRDREGNILYEGWVRVKTSGDGIPLQDFATDQYLGYDQMGRIQVVCSDRFDGCGAVPKFSHVDVVSENPEGSVSGRIGSIIKDRLNINNLYDFQVSHPSGFDFSIFLTDPEHKLTLTMRPEPDSSFVEILTAWNDPILEGGQEYRISTSLTLRAKILGVDNAGRLIGAVALSEMPPEGADYDEWRADVWNAAIFLHSSMVLQQEDLSNIQDLSVLNSIMHNARIKSTEGDPWVIMEPDH